jgi:hypothetical protein
MARAVLRHWHLLVAGLSVLVPACSGGVRGTPSSCPAIISASDPVLQRTYSELKRRIESGPVVGALGLPVSCQARADDGSVRLEYEFARGQKLEAYRDTQIELTEQHLTKAGLSENAALTLLQQIERWAFDGAGCNVSWLQPPSRQPGSGPNSSARVYRGDVCNCQGRLEFTGDVLVGLVFRSAC